MVFLVSVSKGKKISRYSVLREQLNRNLCTCWCLFIAKMKNEFTRIFINNSSKISQKQTSFIGIHEFRLCYKLRKLGCFDKTKHSFTEEPCQFRRWASWTFDTERIKEMLNRLITCVSLFKLRSSIIAALIFIQLINVEQRFPTFFCSRNL